MDYGPRHLLWKAPGLSAAERPCCPAIGAPVTTPVLASGARSLCWEPSENPSRRPCSRAGPARFAPSRSLCWASRRILLLTPKSYRPQDMPRPRAVRRSPAPRRRQGEATEGGLRVGVGGAVMIKPNHATHLPPRPQATPGPRAVRRARRGRAAKAERSEAAEGGLRVGVGGAVVVKPTRRTALPPNHPCPALRPQAAKASSHSHLPSRRHSSRDRVAPSFTGGPRVRLLTWRWWIRRLVRLGVCSPALLEAIIHPLLPRRVVGIRDRVTSTRGDEEESEQQRAEHLPAHSAGADSRTCLRRESPSS